ncbi:MAG: class I SAM-dependent methyltransferase [Gallionellaceae bacterium]
MSQNSNPLSTPGPWNLVADGYAETTAQLLSQYAEEAIAASRIIDSATILDVACGPGSLSLRLAMNAASVHCIDFSETMLAIFRQKIEQAGMENIFVRQGDAQELPYADDMFDAAFSNFGLMFFPCRHKGFAEIYRTLKSGGSVAVTSWAPIDQSPALQTMFGALRIMNPALPEPQRAVASLENPDVFRQELLDAGFKNVQLKCVTKYFPVESIPAFWDAMVKGSAPIQMLKKGMGAALWQEKEMLALNWLQDQLPSTPTSLSSDAWLPSSDQTRIHVKH